MTLVILVISVCFLFSFYLFLLFLLQFGYPYSHTTLYMIYIAAPHQYISCFLSVEKIRGIHTASAGLESTSLVLAYGLDLFFTRVTPSRKFDVLKEDFDYIFISGVLSALILGTIISSKLASMRKLNLSWL